MKAKDLKSSILQMAVQGKLVPQDPADETAAVLLERIRTERANLIKEKKIKAPKGGESVIYLGSDGSRYEKRVDAKGRESEPVCIDDEIPFEIPEGWEWTRVSSIGELIRGSGIKRTETIEEGLPCVRYGELYTTYDQAVETVASHVSQELFDRSQHVAVGDLLMTLTGENKIDIGRAVYNASGGEVAYGGDLIALKAHSQNPAFLAMCLNSPYVGTQRTALATGNIIVHLSGGKIGSLLIPVPPLAEQRRIAARISELMPLVEEYGKLEDEREALDAALPERLRKSLLQIAVEGKLAPQDPSDEPASTLLDRIREERVRLIKEKKTKAPKGGESVIYLGSDGRRYEKRVDAKGRESEPVCIDDGIPFEIPEGWEWARLSAIAEVLNGDRGKNYPAKSKLKDEGIPFVSALNIDGGIVSLNQMKYLSTEQFEALRAGKLNRDDIVFCIRGSLGKFGIFPFDSGAIASSLVIVRINDSELVTLPYLRLLLGSPITAQQIRMQNNGTAQPNLAANSFMNFIYPIPPLAEQRRIAKRLDSVLANID